MAELTKRGKYWQATWYDAAGKRRRKSTRQTNRRAAEEIARSWELETSVRRPDPFTVGDALRLAGEKQARKGNVSIQDSKKRAEHVARILGDKTDLHAPSLNVSVLGNRYVDARRTEITHWGAPVKDPTIAKELGVLAQGMREGKRQGAFFGEPSALFPDELQRESPPGDRWLPSSEYRALLDVATPHRRDWIIFYCNTGADVGEAHRVRRLEDVDLDWGKYGRVHLRGTKTEHRDRWVPLNEDSRAAVDRRLRYPGKYLFAPKWTSHQVAQCMKRWCPKAGIEHVVVKDMRRTFCSWLCNAGVKELFVLKLMGHADSKMLRRVYAQLSPETLADAVMGLPSVANVCQQNVLTLDKARQKRVTETAEEAKNA